MRKLISDMTSAEIQMEIRRLTNKVMNSNQLFRYRSLTEALHTRLRAAQAAASREVSE